MTADSGTFTPPRGMANPHVQTILSSMGRKFWRAKDQEAFQAATSRQIITVDDVQLAVDLNTKVDRPLVIIIPGWLGSSTSSYALSCAQQLGMAGYSTARINLRDHGDTAHLNQGMFNSALISEVTALVALLSTEFGQNGTALMGYSLGGNFALRVARAQPNLPTLAICPAIEPATTMHRIDRSPIYQRYFVNKWRRVWREKQAAFPNDYEFGDALNLTTVSTLTDYFVRHHSEFDSTEKYFDAYDLSKNALQGVTAHILAAHDDPIIPSEHYANLPKSLSITLTDQGGHGAYLDSWQLTSWADNYAVRFFNEIFAD